MESRVSEDGKGWDYLRGAAWRASLKEPIPEKVVGKDALQNISSGERPAYSQRCKSLRRPRA